jgi:hypothetical protein
VKLRHLSLLRKPKPISKRLDLVSAQEPFRKPKTHFSKVGSSSPVVSLIPNASPEVQLSDASPEEVLLPTPKSEAVRRCPGEAGGSLALLPRSEDSPVTTELLPGQCSAPKPLKFYNRKSLYQWCCFFCFFSAVWGFTDLFGGCSRPGKQCPSN